VSGTCSCKNAMCILPFLLLNADNSLCCAVDVFFQNWAYVLLVSVWFFFLIILYFSKIVSFDPIFLNWLIGGVTVGFLGNTVVMIYLLLVLRSDRSTSIVVVDWIPFSPAVSGAWLVFGLFVCNWNSSDDTSVMEGEVSFLGLFSLGTCGVVICEIVTERSYYSISTRVFGSHSFWLEKFSISGLDVWTYGMFLFLTLISKIIPQGS